MPSPVRVNRRYLSVNTAPDGDRSQVAHSVLGQDADVHHHHAEALLAAAVLVGLVLAAGLSGRYGLRGVAALAALSLLWILVNGPMEGPVLLVFTPHHGLTGADLSGVAGLTLAALRLRVLRRPDRSPEGAGAGSE